MANSNFIVQNGLQVGPLTIDAATGSITTSGNVSITGNLGVSQISKNDSSIGINDTGAGSNVSVIIDGVQEMTVSPGGVTVTNGDLTLNAQGDLRFADADSSNYVALQAPATVATNVTWTLPAADGTANQALVTNGSGTLSWAAAGATLTDDTTTNATRYIMFEDATSGYATSVLVSSSKLTYNPSTGVVGATGVSTTGDVVIGGNLKVNGITTTIETNDLVVEDKNIIIGNVATPTDVTADGGGITLKGATDKTLNWVDATDAWTSSENLNLVTGKAYEINGASVLNATTLGSSVVNSSLTSVGTLTNLTVTNTITGSVSGNAGTATKLATARTIALTGDVTGSATFDGSGNISIATTSSADSIVLGTDTTGNYVASLTNGAFLTGANGGSEGAALTLAVDATSANTGSKVVARDAAGSFSANVITATLSGTATQVSNALTINNSGTGSASGSTYNGSGAITISHNSIGAAPQAGNASIVTVGNVTTGTWSATDIGVAHGGTGASDAATARTNLGLAIGTDVQAYNATLAAVAGGTYTGDDSITTVGTIGAGTWNATTIATGKGGTGLTTFTSGGALYATSTSALTTGTLPVASGGTGVTTSTGSGSVVLSTSPSLTTPVIGAATGTSLALSGALNATGAATLNSLGVNVDVVIGGNLTVNGTTTTMNTDTVTVEDKNITLANVATPTDVTADGGGITVLGATNKTFNWTSAASAWTSSEDINVVTGKGYEVNGTSVLNATTLGSSVVNSSLTSVGTLTNLTVTNTISGSVSGNAGTATKLATARTISLTGDVTGSVSFDGSGNAAIAATIAADSVALGTDTTGNYVASLVAGTGISVGAAGESATPTVTNTGVTGLTGTANQVTVSASTGSVTLSLPQNIHTGAAPTFAGITVPSITHSGTTGTGDIGASGAAFGTVWAKATSAQYADLAEYYAADAEYEPGTVVCFGGEAEVTNCDVDHCRKVAGVVSTNPAYIMNSELQGTRAAVALQGRVPCKVVGPVRKGDMMVAAGNGRARAEADPKLGAVIGKALENFDGTEGVIEVVIGRV